MVRQANNKKITAIVPTYNEVGRIERVLNVLTTYPGFKEIIVVDDGSTDDTEEVLKKYQVRYIKNQVNRGKGYVMNLGVKNAKSDIIFFADADVSGLSHEIIDNITRPVLDGEVEMFIGMRNRKVYYLHYAILLIPLLGGERALTKTLWQTLPDYYKHRFRVEAGLNFYAKHFGKGFRYKVFKGLSQVIKERKYGLKDGLKQRWDLYAGLISAQLRLQFIDTPQLVKKRRSMSLFENLSYKSRNQR